MPPQGSGQDENADEESVPTSVKGSNQAYSPGSTTIESGRGHTVGNINAAVVGEASLDERKELPLGCELFADGKRNWRELAQLFVGFGRLVADRFFNPVKRANWHLLQQTCALSDAQSCMKVRSKRRPGPNCRTYSLCESSPRITH
jgi:hypothetical protein